MIRSMTTAVMLSAVAVLGLLPITAHSQDYFVPNQPRQTAPVRRSAPPQQRPAAASPQFAPPQDAGPGDPGADNEPPPVQFAAVFQSAFAAFQTTFAAVAGPASVRTSTTGRKLRNGAAFRTDERARQRRRTKERLNSIQRRNRNNRWATERMGYNSLCQRGEKND